MFLARVILLVLAGFVRSGAAEIAPALDAPQPLSPAESVQRFQVPRGFHIEVIASEPLIREPSGVCWDEHGRLFVSELHGYNLEGHLDVQELNKTGVLDHEVRRIAANPKAQEEARKETYGTVKQLIDSDGDGRADRVVVFADRLPPVYGIVPARGGLIAACAPDIVYLADRDGDGVAEVREVLFTGFAVGALERGVNSPKWGLDDWIYFGIGHGGGTITGPHLPTPVRLGRTNFRIRSDGSALEAVTGSTHTIGFTFTDDGECFVTDTSSPGRYVTPISWRYLARNPDASAPAADEDAGGDRRVRPIAPPHPWRAKRAQDPGFFKFYRDRYGAGDSDASGWFTSACSPLIYGDSAWPEEFRGAYFVCEPSGNLIHRAVIESDGPRRHLRRAPEEGNREFLASSDPWFHPIALAHGPDGALYITDFYREIIEDYSAVPRYLQQQYGLVRGQNHGRIWRLQYEGAPRDSKADMSGLSPAELVREVASPRFWRRQTAQRLLIERGDPTSAPALSKELRSGARDSGGGSNAPGSREAVLNTLYTLKGLGALKPTDVQAVLDHRDGAVRKHALRLSETWLGSDPSLLERVLALVNDPAPDVRLQLALTVGEIRDARALDILARLAFNDGDMPWMANAVVSSLSGRADTFVNRFFTPEVMHSDGSRFLHVLEVLAGAIGARGEPTSVGRILIIAADADAAGVKLGILRGLAAVLKTRRSHSLPPSARPAVDRLVSDSEAEVRRLASLVGSAFRIEDPAQERALIGQASHDAGDVTLSPQVRRSAVELLKDSDDAAAMNALMEAWEPNTPKLRDLILDALMSRRERRRGVLDAIEHGKIPASALTAFQRLSLIESDEGEVRNRAARVLSRPRGANEETFQRFALALRAPRDPGHGEQVFRDHCATCHQIRDIGFAVGPDLAAEGQRAEETILRDILAPNDGLTAGYSTYEVTTTSGETIGGILGNESATGLTLRLPAGLERNVLLKDVASIRVHDVSLMPEALAAALAPRDAADVIAWLRGPNPGNLIEPDPKVLFDEEPEFVIQLNEGEGRASLIEGRASSGNACLSITPPQRYSARIQGWNFAVRERPQPGEFRYLRLAWRSSKGEGVMIELAADGHWPSPTDPERRYFAGRNSSAWAAREVSPEVPREWRVVTFDLWKDNGSFSLTGIAPTALGGTAFFDRIELIRDLRTVAP